MREYRKAEQKGHAQPQLPWYDQFREIFDAFVEWYDSNYNQQPNFKRVCGRVEVEVLVWRDARLVGRFEHRVPAWARAEPLVDEASVRLPKVPQNGDMCDWKKRWK